MKKKKTTIILLSIFFMGLFILLYPMISQFYNAKHQSQAIASYEDNIKKISSSESQKMLSDANAYNKELSELMFPLVQYKKLKNYNKLLNANDDGMMGYVSIEKLKVEIPIYHGTGAEILNVAAGHFEGSSLPVGGDSTHSIISAHRGLPSSKLFTDLDMLEIGDIFQIIVLDKALTYQVDKITVVTPDKIKDLVIENDKDYVTLLTCTPYGINTHRLLVRGVRLQTDEEKKMFINSEVYQVDRLIVTSIIALVIIVTLMIYVSLKPVKREIKEVIKL